jgi:caffeoyl-CoA O-methyltransferase
MVMTLLSSDLNNYLDNLLPKRNEVLSKMEEIAMQNNFPIVGPQVGYLLLQYAKIMKAKNIIELGSGYGYSAIWFAMGTESDTKIICTDGSEENKIQALQYFKELNLSDKIDFRVGDAVNILNSTSEEFDIIYNDVDKEGYPQVYQAAIPRLRKGGLLITDNTLWYGRVIENPAKSEATLGVKKYNELAFTDPRVISVILPVRDGVCVSLKI